MIQDLLQEVGELDAHTDRFDSTLQRHFIGYVERCTTASSGCMSWSKNLSYRPGPG